MCLPNVKNNYKTYVCFCKQNTCMCSMCTFKQLLYFMVLWWVILLYIHVYIYIICIWASVHLSAAHWANIVNPKDWSDTFEHNFSRSEPFFSKISGNWRSLQEELESEAFCVNYIFSSRKFLLQKKTGRKNEPTFWTKTGTRSSKECPACTRAWPVEFLSNQGRGLKRSQGTSRSPSVLTRPL